MKKNGGHGSCPRRKKPLSSDKTPEELIATVVTPGGTTAAGLQVMQQHSTAAGISAAIEAAAARGREMAKENR